MKSAIPILAQPFQRQWRIAPEVSLVNGLAYRLCRLGADCRIKTADIAPLPLHFALLEGKAIASKLPSAGLSDQDHQILTDNGQEFTDRRLASREREPSGQHVFDQTCQQFNIEHRLIKPRTSRTNGMVERFNGRIADVLKAHRFNNQEDLTQTLHRYVYLYNHELPQSALHSKTPMQAMRDWYDQKPVLFNKNPVALTAQKSVSNRPGCDNYTP